MKNVLATRRGWLLGLVVVLGVATVALAQFGGGGGGPAPRPMEFTMQDVDSTNIVQAMNDLGKERWDIFQVVPIWSIKSQNGEAELTPRAYQIFARRPSFGARPAVPENEKK